MSFRIYLSPPKVSNLEKEYALDALSSGWVAPLGPHVDAFEKELSTYVEVDNALALSSGTAGLHLALLVAGVKPGDRVVVPTLTFAATAFAVKYVGATPVFLDSESTSWNMDPDLLETFLSDSQSQGSLPTAVIAVDLFGQTANYERIEAICETFGVLLIEDAAEGLGARNRERKAGSFGKVGIFSFNGNKIITTSGGGMMVSDDAEFIAKARYLATQARQPVPWYEHHDVGYNYRMSNVLAAIGRAQLENLESIITSRADVRRAYSTFAEQTGRAKVLADAPWGTGNNWLTVATLNNSSEARALMQRLAENGIESRPIWKPMHQQPVFANAPTLLNGTSDDIFDRGICLPSSDPSHAEEVIHIWSKL